MAGLPHQNAACQEAFFRKLFQECPKSAATRNSEQHPPRGHPSATLRAGSDTEEGFFLGLLRDRSRFLRDKIMNSLFSLTPCLRGEVLVCEHPPGTRR